jgi:anti-sigma regulatory factor (Ser/Thr protein kinase)
VPPEEPVPTNGLTPFAAGCVRSLMELEQLKATCQHQTLAIEALTDELSNVRADHAALKARTADPPLKHPATHGAGDRTEIRLRLDALAPGAARILVAQSLGDHASATLLDTAKLLISELVTNAVRHSGGSCHDAILVRVHTMRRTLRLEVEDPGRHAVIAPRAPDPTTGDGFGLHLVHTLSETWGIERAADRGTRIWAQLDHEPLTAPPA